MNARLGGRVIHLPILARLAVDRSDIHDPAPAAIPHAGKAGLRHVEAAAQIDADHFVPIFKAHIQESAVARNACIVRSEEHTSELQSLMRISYAVFCLKKKKT